MVGEILGSSILPRIHCTFCGAFFLPLRVVVPSWTNCLLLNVEPQDVICRYLLLHPTELPERVSSCPSVAMVLRVLGADGVLFRLCALRGFNEKYHRMLSLLCPNYDFF